MSAPPTRFLAILLVLCCVGSAASAKKKPEGLRWSEGATGCTFSADQDGKARWGMWTGDAGVVLAIDANELQRSRRRLQHTFAVEVTIRNRALKKLNVDPRKITAEFVNHHHTVASGLDPEGYSGSLQAGAIALQDSVERQIKKHPDQRPEKEAALVQYQGLVTDLQQFIRRHSLRQTTLDTENNEAVGWVFFPTTARWIGELKNPEQLVIRIPVADQTMEFPITMPPTNELMLRRR